MGSQNLMVRIRRSKADARMSLIAKAVMVSRNNYFNSKFDLWGLIVILRVAQKGKDLRKTSWRWFMLAMACGFLMGSYFCYDNPGPIKTQLERDFGWSDSKWSLLYTVYSIPNMVLPIVGGVFLDKIGMRVGLILFTILLTVG